MRSFKVSLVDLDGVTVPAWVIEKLVADGIEISVLDCKTRDELMRVAKDADIVWLLGGSRILNAETIKMLPRCGAILRSGSGTDNVPVTEATRLGIVVANTPEAQSEQVADHTIGLLFAVVRQIANHDRMMRTGSWERGYYKPFGPLCGKTLGLVGFGHVPQTICRRMKGYEMKFLSFDPYVPLETITNLGARGVNLDELMSQSDYVSVHCPATRETFHLIKERELRLMKPTAILINASRGSVLEESSLIQALTEGWIRGAGLDVFEQEPINPDNPLLKLENVVLTPHMAGMGEGTAEARWDLSVETILDLFHGKWPRSYVNKLVKPRWSLTPRI
jgi:D-3-phosphoglycerate dehydrogenase / 2-oxoglutarate reductase